MVNRVMASGFQVRSYFHRCTEGAVDLCDVLGSYTSQAKVKLDQLATGLGLPGKLPDVDGSQVEDLVGAGKLDEVAQYCESDVLNTYRVWLVYELFRGSITPQGLDWSEAQAREFIENRRSSNPHLMAAVSI
jgi:predicted PolB exonuclease-like 3'-5' exonuclease